MQHGHLPTLKAVLSVPCPLCHMVAAQLHNCRFILMVHNAQYLSCTIYPPFVSCVKGTVSAVPSSAYWQIALSYVCMAESLWKVCGAVVLTIAQQHLGCPIGQLPASREEWFDIFHHWCKACFKPTKNGIYLWNLVWFLIPMLSDFQNFVRVLFTSSTPVDHDDTRVINNSCIVIIIIFWRWWFFISAHIYTQKIEVKLRAIWPDRASPRGKTKIWTGKY